MRAGPASPLDRMTGFARQQITKVTAGDAIAYDFYILKGEHILFIALTPMKPRAG